MTKPKDVIEKAITKAKLDTVAANRVRKIVDDRPDPKVIAAAIAEVSGTA